MFVFFAISIFCAILVFSLIFYLSPSTIMIFDTFTGTRYIFPFSFEEVMFVNFRKFFTKTIPFTFFPFSDILIWETSNGKRITRYYSSSFFKPWMLKFGFSPPHTSSFIIKQTYEKVGLYDISFKIAGDFEFFVRCFLKERISYKITNQCNVIMSIGGLSGKNLMSYCTSTLEILQSFKKNKIYSNIFFILLRFPIKVFQFF